MKALKLKLGAHMDSELLYPVYQNQGWGPITLGVTFLDWFYKFQLMKKFCSTFLKNCKGNKFETWYTHGDWVDVHVSCIQESGPRAHNSWS